MHTMKESSRQMLITFVRKQGGNVEKTVTWMARQKFYGSATDCRKLIALAMVQA